MRKIILSVLLITCIFSFTNIHAYESTEKGEDVIENVDTREVHEENPRESRWWWTCAKKDSYESNNSMSKATNLNIGDGGSKTIYGTLHKQPRRCGGATDVDFYKFTVYKDSSVNITLSNIPSGKDYDLKIFDHTGKQIGSSTRGSNKSEAITKTLKTGHYYIRVNSYSGTSDSAQYKLYTKKTTVSGVTKYLQNETQFTWYNEYMHGVVASEYSDNLIDGRGYRLNNVNNNNQGNYVIEYNKTIPYEYTYINSEEIMLKVLDELEIALIITNTQLSNYEGKIEDPTMISDICGVVSASLTVIKNTTPGKIVGAICAGTDLLIEHDQNNVINNYKLAISEIEDTIEKLTNTLNKGRSQMQIFTTIHFGKYYVSGTMDELNVHFYTKTEFIFEQVYSVNSSYIPNSNYSGYFK